MSVSLRLSTRSEHNAMFVGFHTFLNKLCTNKKGKYGRYLGTVYRQRKSGEEQLNINQQLIEEGFAVEYYGGKR